MNMGNRKPPLLHSVLIDSQEVNPLLILSQKFRDQLNGINWFLLKHHLPCFALLFAKILFLAELTIIVTAAHTTTVLTAVISSTERSVSFKYIFNNCKIFIYFFKVPRIGQNLGEKSVFVLFSLKFFSSSHDLLYAKLLGRELLVYFCCGKGVRVCSVWIFCKQNILNCCRKR